MCRKCGFQPGCKVCKGSSQGAAGSILLIMKAFVLGSVLCAIPKVDSFYFPSTTSTSSTCTNPIKHADRNFGRSWLKAVATMPENKFADLTPAVDKFAKLPPQDILQTYHLRARGPAPPGPEPFGLVKKDIQPLSDYVKEEGTSSQYGHLQIPQIVSLMLRNTETYLIILFRKKKCSTEKWCILLL